MKYVRSSFRCTGCAMLSFYLPTYLPTYCLPAYLLPAILIPRRRDAGVVLPPHTPYIHTYYIHSSLSWSHWAELVSHIHTYLAIAFCHILTPLPLLLWLFGVVGYLACIPAVSASATRSRTLVSIYQTTPTRAQPCVGRCHYVLNNQAESDKRQSKYILNPCISLYRNKNKNENKGLYYGDSSPSSERHHSCVLLRPERVDDGLAHEETDGDADGHRYHRASDVDTATVCRNPSCRRETRLKCTGRQ
jgi:hypothetical protein